MNFPYFRFIIPALSAFAYLFSFFPISSFTSVMLVTQGLNAVAMATHELGLRLLEAEPGKDGEQQTEKDKEENNKRGKTKDKRTDNLDDMLSKSDHILAILEGAEGSYGNLAFDECASTLLISIMSLYYSLSCFVYLAGSGTSRFMLNNGLCNLVLCSVSLYRLYYTVSHGQWIEDEVATVVKIFRLKKNVNLFLSYY